MFQGLPRDLQQQTLLGIHGRSLTRGDAEELRVKPVHRFRQEPTMAGAHFPRHVWIGVIMGVHVPSGLGHLNDGVPPVVQQSPERLRVIRHARESAPHADDGDRFGSRTF